MPEEPRVLKKKAGPKPKPRIALKPNTKANYFMQDHAARIGEIREKVSLTYGAHNRGKKAGAIFKAVLEDPVIQKELSILFHEDREAWRATISQIKYFLFPQIKAVFRPEF